MNMIFGEVLSQLDSKLMYILGGLLIMTVIVALIKKAIKIAITVGLIAFCVTSLGPIAKDFQNKYKMEVDKYKAIITIDNQKTVLNKEEIKSIQLINHGLSGYTLNITYKDGVASINIPNFMMNKVKSFAENSDIQVEVRN